MDRNLIDQSSRQLSNSYIVELVGPAGAGKSSLARTMSQMNGQVVFSNPPNFHEINQIPFFAINTLQTAPQLFSYLFTKRPSSASSSQIASIVVLNGWYRHLCKNQNSSGEVLLLDQGPVFLLTDLFEFNWDDTQSNNLKKWQANVYKHWANTIDLVVWLDAPDPILMSRINAREKHHIMKQQSEREVYRFLSLSRQTLDQTLMKLSRINRSLKILEIDTSQDSPLSITSKIISYLELMEDLI